LVSTLIPIGKSLEEMEIQRPEPTDEEVKIEVLYCGVCHSCTQVAKRLKNTIYPHTNNEVIENSNAAA
jgi:D-arabinose 1-dehydrogenase-like Zn-dependent alcohol dehydrogenase